MCYSLIRLYSAISPAAEHDRRKVITVCCRYYVEPQNETLQQYGDVAARTKVQEQFLRAVAKPLMIRGEVRPTDIAPVIATSKRGNKACFPMQWGFNVAKRPVLPNARLETAAAKPLFQAAWKAHRCVIPASWYYEWEHFTDENGRKKTGRKFAICPGPSSLQNEMSVSAVSALKTISPETYTVETSALEKTSSTSTAPRNILAETVRKASSVTWLCGLYRIENNVPVFVVLTREPGRELSRIHDRMPLILPPDAALEWVRPQAKPEDLLKYSLTEMEIREAH